MTNIIIATAIVLISTTIIAILTQFGGRTLDRIFSFNNQETTDDCIEDAVAFLIIGTILAILITLVSKGL